VAPKSATPIGFKIKPISFCLGFAFDKLSFEFANVAVHMHNAESKKYIVLMCVILNR
jgi:hypothetical protein